MFNWITRLLSWFARGKLSAFAIFVVVVAICVPFFFEHKEPAIRISGMILQLFGIAAAALGIRDTRRMFGKPSFLQLIRNWTTSCPRFNPEVHNLSVSNVRQGSRSGSAAVTQWPGVAPDATLEQRMDALEANLRSVEGRLRSAEGAIFTNARDTSKLQQESQVLDTKVEKLHHKVEATLTDGLHLAAAGVFWLVFGVVFSTVPCELLSLGRWLSASVTLL